MKFSGPGEEASGSGELGYVGCLRPFLALDDLELNLVAFLQTFIAVAGDRAVMDEYIRSFVAAQEPVSLRVVEPLHRAFQSFHVRFPP